MRSRMVERWVVVSLALASACSGGQGGDPGQTTGGTGGSAGSSEQGGTGGTAGSSGYGGTPGGCPEGVEDGIGIVSAELMEGGGDSEFRETLDLSEGGNGSFDIERRLGGLIVTTRGGDFWDVELGEPVRKRRVEHEGSLEGIVARDLDGDGDEDLVGVGESSRTNDSYLFLWERVEGELVARDGFEVVIREAAAVAVGDVDGDGAPDLASVDEDGPFVMRNDGALQFTRFAGGSGFAGCPDCIARAVQLDDRNDDDALDLVVLLASREGDGFWISVQEGDGTGSFAGATLTKISSQPLPGTATWARPSADIDADGRLDFVLTQLEETFVFFGDTAGAYRAQESLGYVVNDMLDIDGDGRLDLVSSGNGELVLRYGRSADAFEERRYPVALRAGAHVVVEPARGSAGPRVHWMYDTEHCQGNCGLPDCEVCVFDTCVECLNHDDCGTGSCNGGWCFPVDGDDGGI